MRFVADMSIQMILGESTSLIAAVGFIQLYNFMYNRSDDIYIYFFLDCNDTVLLYISLVSSC